MSAPALRLLAGQRARQHISEHGLRADDVSTLLGASGGPKWMVLSGLDRYLAGEFFRGRTRPLDMVGSSIGVWRYLCYSQPDPVAAIDRFEAAYLQQTYPEHPSPEYVSQVALDILKQLVGEGGEAQVVDHPVFHLHICTVRSRWVAQATDRHRLLAGLGLSALANLLDRRLLGHFFERVMFQPANRPSPLHRVSDFNTQYVPLTENNLFPAVMASAAIPMVMAEVENIPGAPPGVYRDGGIIDYHFDVPFRPEGLLLYPHFYPYLVPGWFDKSLKWRRVKGSRLSRTLMLCPSDRWVADLPGGKIPDRKDFLKMTDEQRVAAWKQVLSASRALGEEFAEWLDRGCPIDAVEALQ